MRRNLTIVLLFTLCNYFNKLRCFREFSDNDKQEEKDVLLSHVEYEKEYGKVILLHWWMKAH